MPCIFCVFIKMKLFERNLRNYLLCFNNVPGIYHHAMKSPYISAYKIVQFDHHMNIIPSHLNSTSSNVRKELCLYGFKYYTSLVNKSYAHMHMLHKDTVRPLINLKSIRNVTTYQALCIYFIVIWNAANLETFETLFG